MDKQRQVSSPVNGGSQYANKNFMARPKPDLSQRLAQHKSPADQNASNNVETDGVDFVNEITPTAFLLSAVEVLNKAKADEYGLELLCRQ